MEHPKKASVEITRGARGVDTDWTVCIAAEEELAATSHTHTHTHGWEVTGDLMIRFCSWIDLRKSQMNKQDNHATLTRTNNSLSSTGAAAENLSGKNPFDLDILALLLETDAREVYGEHFAAGAAVVDA
jgi:hypothetical protein